MLSAYTYLVYKGTTGKIYPFHQTHLNCISATAATFGRVIDECTQRFPASSYGLIFSSHASGWLPKHTLSYPNFTSSIGSDSGNGTKPSTSSDEIDLTEFAGALKDNQFDFIVFNACFMTGIEVAYELRNKTKYILGSSAEILGEGFEPVLKTSFHTLLNPDIAVPTALQNFGNDYYTYVMAQTGASQSTTLSVLDTKPLNLFASLFKHSLPLNVDVENVSGLQQFDRPGVYGESIKKPRFFDLQEVIQKRTTPELYASFNAVINQIVLWKAATPWMFIGYSGFAVNRHCGITTYLKQIEFTTMNNSYSSLAWYKDTH